MFENLTSIEQTLFRSLETVASTTKFLLQTQVATEVVHLTKLSTGR